jgi:hypothetical protein
LEHSYDQRYDGDDEDGATQAAINDGSYVMFDSTVRVLLDGKEIGCDHLGSSVYDADDIADFWTSHRDKNPMNRNCSLMRAVRGQNVVICHELPSMVYEAIHMARQTLVERPYARASQTPNPRSKRNV